MKEDRIIELKMLENNVKELQAQLAAANIRIMELLKEQDLKKLCKEYPNDSELGAHIRLKYYESI